MRQNISTQYCCFVSQIVLTFGGWIWGKWEWWLVCLLMLQHTTSVHIYKTNSLWNLHFQAKRGAGGGYTESLSAPCILSWSKVRHVWRQDPQHGRANTEEHCAVKNQKKIIWPFKVSWTTQKWKDHVLKCGFPTGDATGVPTAQTQTTKLKHNVNKPNLEADGLQLDSY